MKVVPISLSRQESSDERPGPTDPRRIKTVTEIPTKQVLELAKLPATFQLSNDGVRVKSEKNSSNPVTSLEKPMTSAEEKRKKQDELLKRARSKIQKSPTKQLSFTSPAAAAPDSAQTRQKLSPLIVSPHLQSKPGQQQPFSAPVILQQLTSFPPQVTTSTMVPPPSPKVFQANCLPPLTPPYSPLIPDMRQPPPNYRPMLKPVSSQPHYVQFPPPSPSPNQSSGLFKFFWSIVPSNHPKLNFRK